MTTVYHRGVNESSEAYMKRALNAARDLYPKCKEDHGCCHNSFPASDTLQKIEQMFPDLGTFGVEGLCDSLGEDGVTYLNVGDVYTRTICFYSQSERFYIKTFEAFSSRFRDRD
jgi:hypothetical protein